MGGFGEELGKETAKLAGDIYKDTAQIGFRQMGTAFGAVMEWTLQKTYILRLSNERRRLQFEHNMKMLSAKFASIPEQKTIETSPEISVPVLEKLSYTTNQDIAKAFINLLAKASNLDTVDQAHPSFIYLIDRLSADEAKIIQYLYAQKINRFPYVEVYRENIVDKSQMYIERYLTDFSYISLDFPKNMSFYMSNMIALGVVLDGAPKQLYNDSPYQTLFNHHSDIIKKATSETPAHLSLVMKKSILEVTDYGRKFMKACF